MTGDATSLAIAGRPYSVLSLFTGAGGLDLGFERAGFGHLGAVELDPWCVKTLLRNRPSWKPVLGDVRSFDPAAAGRPDVLLAGFPCQGFSLGGSRDAGDERNLLYREVVRIAQQARPRVVMVENVLNLRTMRLPETDRPFAEQIAAEMRSIGYEVFYDIFRVSQFGVPQTRRRFVFVGFLDGAPPKYGLPQPGPTTTIRRFLYDLGQDERRVLPNHVPTWGFRSAVHVETGEPFDPTEAAVPVRLSRTASDGHPVRSFDEPFPAVDTATIWGWAQGNVRVARYPKDRANGKHIRNPDATVTLWRVSASRLRAFTHREYARLQTFPDDWTFEGGNKRDVHLQIGNAVPVNFAETLARNVRLALDSLTDGTPFFDEQTTHNLVLV